MKIDALLDVAWIKADKSRMTVREVLLNMHRDDVQLSRDVPGYEYTAQLRFLASVLAVVLREMDEAEWLQGAPLDERAVDEALGKLAEGADIFDVSQPFMQRPMLPSSGPKDTSRKIGPGDFPVKKLSPSMMPDEAEDYWNLFEVPNSLGLPDAVLQLVVFHFMSMAGNNSYDRDKCQMGSPAMRWVGADYTLTELTWLDTTLLSSLLGMIPIAWVNQGGLPAWADRTGEYSRDDDGSMKPLWKATWSSNAAVCHWDGEALTGVRIGGIPQKWYAPEMGNNSQTWKAWWDVRNEVDPFFLYSKRETGELKLERLDLGRDATDLAVEWAADNKMDAFMSGQEKCKQPDDEPRIAFIRHQLAGTASSPNIRASEIFVPDTDLWSFDLDEELRIRIMEYAQLFQKAHWAVCRPFRRRASKESELAFVLDDLENRRQDVSTLFWRNITDIFEEIIAVERRAKDDASAKNEGLEREWGQKIVAGAMNAFDEITSESLLGQPSKIAYVRGDLVKRISNIAFANV